MRKRWLAASYDKDLAAQIAEEHSLNPIAALLAVIRGLRDGEEIEDFFDPNPFFYSRSVRPAGYGQGGRTHKPCDR